MTEQDSAGKYKGVSTMEQDSAGKYMGVSTDISEKLLKF